MDDQFFFGRVSLPCFRCRLLSGRPRKLFLFLRYEPSILLSVSVQVVNITTSLEMSGKAPWRTASIFQTAAAAWRPRLCDIIIRFRKRSCESTVEIRSPSSHSVRGFLSISYFMRFWSYYTTFFISQLYCFVGRNPQCSFTFEYLLWTLNVAFCKFVCDSRDSRLFT